MSDDRAASVMVHGLAMARLALLTGRDCGRAVRLVSGEGAASYAGAGWWRALMAASHAAVPGAMVDDVLDCGSAPGRALEALHVGQRLLVLRTTRLILADVRARAAAQGAVVLEEAPPALDLGLPGAERALEAWLRSA